MKKLASIDSSVFDSIPNGVCIFRENFEVVLWNDLIEKWSQIPRREILGKSLLEVFPHLKTRGYLERIRQVAQGAPTAVFSSKLHRGLIPCPSSDGQLMPQKYQLSRFTNSEEMTYLLLFVEDVSDSVAHIQTYKDLRTKAENASRSKSSFLATMSHEIRTPMNAVLSCTNLLMDTPKTTEDLELLRTIQSSGDTLLTLINDILDFSKIESGKMKLEMQPFNLHESIREIVELLKPKALERDVQISIAIDDDVPKWIVGDSTRFRQILTNIIGNAVKFTQSQVRVLAHVNLPAAPLVDEKCLLEISIKDNGIGISNEAQSRLFKSFSQVDASTTRKFGGTGLGLAICKGLTEAMGGKIWVESKLNSGSTFSFSIPVKTAQSQKTKEVIPISQMGPNMGRGHPLKILMAEDNTVNQMVAKKILTKLGYRTDVVADGLEAITALKSVKYDLVLMDQHMPEMDGVEATIQICKLWPAEERPRIVALTASAFKEDRERCLNAGMDDFITKPIQVSELARILENCPSRYGTNVEEGLIDIEAVNNQFKGDEELLRDIANETAKILPIYMSEIRAAIEQEDYKALETSAHSLKGTVANFYVDTVVKIALQLEVMGRKKDMSESEETFKQLDEKIDSLLPELKKMAS